jgi:alkanesulfonate monooxygenase SsuD/methylene tetrahydromethanopterin reductase-like flavin-dependent oxidoreductase (luciferase family)
VLTGGRLDVGLGSGGDSLELQAFGVSADERRARFEASATVLRRLLEGHAAGLDMPPFTVPAIAIEPLPLQDPASMFWMAAIGDASCALAGQLGDHLLLARGIPEERLCDQIEIYRRARAAAGHDPRAGCTQVTRGVYVAESAEQAWAEAAPGIERYYRESKKIPPDAAVPDLYEMARQGYFIVGDPPSCAQQIDALASAVPLTHLACDMYLPRVPHAAIMRSIQLCGEQVMPLAECHGRGRQGYRPSPVP